MTYKVNDNKNEQQKYKKVNRSISEEINFYIMELFMEIR